MSALEAKNAPQRGCDRAHCGADAFSNGLEAAPVLVHALRLGEVVAAAGLLQPFLGMSGHASRFLAITPP